MSPIEATPPASPGEGELCSQLDSLGDALVWAAAQSADGTYRHLGRIGQRDDATHGRELRCVLDLITELLPLASCGGGKVMVKTEDASYLAFCHSRMPFLILAFRPETSPPCHYAFLQGLNLE